MAALQSELFISGTMGTAECFVLIVDPHVSTVSLAERSQGDDSQDSGEHQNNDFYTHQVTIVTDEHEQGNSAGKESEAQNKPSLRASSAGGKSITVSIEGAYPGDVYKLQYRVINEGTIPVELNLGTISENPQLKVESFLIPGERLDPGLPIDEELLITVRENAEGQNNYNFSVELNYSQWKAD